MNDIFKFRVWDKENKCLHYPIRYSNFAIVNGTVVKIESYPTANSAYLGKRIAWEFDDAVIMQCTGLKDKNGKLIYEGDIVKINADLYADLYLEFKDEYAVINYDESRACWMFAYRPRDNSDANIFNLICDYYYFLKWPPTGEIPYNTLAYVEVIGNIYENKELLEEE